MKICFHLSRYQNQIFSLVLHSCRLCSTRVALVSHLCCSCLTLVALTLFVSHSCCKVDQIIFSYTVEQYPHILDHWKIHLCNGKSWSFRYERNNNSFIYLDNLWFWFSLIINDFTNFVRTDISETTKFVRTGISKTELRITWPTFYSFNTC